VTFTPSDTANYNTASTAVTVTVTPLAITGSFTANTKAYDGSTTAVVATRSLSGVLGSDVVSLSGGTATFDNPNVGTGKTVTLTSATLGGAAAGNYSLSSVSTTTADITAAILSSSAITLTAVGDGSYTASATGGASFSYSYAGRTANGIATGFASSGSAPTDPGYYTVTATASGNYSGSKSADYFISGPIPASDTISRPTATMNIPIATLLQNDMAILANGTAQTALQAGLTIVSVTPGVNTTSVALNGSFVSFTPGGSGAEAFTYSLSDGTKQATGTVTVSPINFADKPLSIAGTLGTAVFADGYTEITLQFIGTANVTYYIQYATSVLGPWTDAGGWYSDNGTFNVTIQEEGDHASDWNNSMFFRGKK
jgi:hypothetical protein